MSGAEKHPQAGASLKRELGLVAAIMLGMGSILGTGVFVSIGIAVEATGPSVILAIASASLVAIFNGLSSAQLAANHPVSGGTYEYGYRWLNPPLGFMAGWTFLCAKSASAATAALGFAGYLCHTLGWDSHQSRVVVALITIATLTVITLTGIKRSSYANTLIVSFTLASLLFFVMLGSPTAVGMGNQFLLPFFPESGASGFLRAVALMFVAYTGYGRIATLGEEVKSPRRTIPLAVVWTLGATMLIYVLVAWVAVASVGADAFAKAAHAEVAPLQVIAEQLGGAWAGKLMALGAMTAMLGVLLNLQLGLSRVMLALGRRRDMPSVVARIHPATAVPAVATLSVAALIVCWVLLGDVRLTWSFSAMTVLIYYALTNACALRLTAPQRLFPAWVSLCGLLSCLFLVFWIDRSVLIGGSAILLLGAAWFAAARFLTRNRATSDRSGLDP